VLQAVIETTMIWCFTHRCRVGFLHEDMLWTRARLHDARVRQRRAGTSWQLKQWHSWFKRLCSDGCGGAEHCSTSRNGWV